MNVLKWFFQICTSQDREVVFFLVSLSRDGGSNPPPAINPSIVQRIKMVGLLLNLAESQLKKQVLNFSLLLLKT